MNSQIKIYFEVKEYISEENFKRLNENIITSFSALHYEKKYQNFFISLYGLKKKMK